MLKFEHHEDARITAMDNYGSKHENPGMFEILEKALAALGKKVPDDKVYGYDSDGYESEFKQIVKLLGSDDSLGWNPDEDDLKKLGFKKIAEIESDGSADAVYQNGQMILVAGENSPSMFIFGE